MGGSLIEPSTSCEFKCSAAGQGKCTTRSMEVIMVLKINDPGYPVPVFVLELRVELEHLLFITGERASQAVILNLIPVIEHIHVNFPHQAAGQR